MLRLVQSNPSKICDTLLLFAANMRRIRRSKSLTQEQLAERAELHFNYVSSVERAERNLTIYNIEKIAHALDVTVVEMLSKPSSNRKPE